MKRELGFSAIGCKSMQDGSDYLLREPEAAYTVHFSPEKGTLSPENTVHFNINAGELIC
jgi:hypothetical protein